jgi:hypothetical protein
MATASFCPNCRYPDPGEFCPQCGQEQAERRVTLREMTREFFDEQFGVNQRLPRTIKLLLFKPGLLTNEYFDGRIRRFTAPVRLYLLASVLFFALFAFSQSSPIKIERTAAEVEREIAADTALQRKLRTSKREGGFVGIRVNPADTTNWLESAEVNLIFPPLTRAAEQRLREYAKFGEIEGSRRIIRGAVAQMPKVVFLLLPIYAFLLWLFFRRQRRFYVEHFILSMHLHSFGFLALLPLPLFDMPFWAPWVASVGDVVSAVIMLWIFIYIFIALRRVYRQGRIMTGIKYFFLSLLYLVIFTFGVILSGVLALTM